MSNWPTKNIGLKHQIHHCNSGGRWENIFHVHLYRAGSNGANPNTWLLAKLNLKYYWSVKNKLGLKPQSQIGEVKD